jgi:DNA-binding transcriptional regulator YdaS (Cro superfamily)
VPFKIHLHGVAKISHLYQQSTLTYTGKWISFMSMKNATKHIERAIALLGSQTALADAAGYSQNGVWQARNRGHVSPELAKGIHRATNGEVPGSDLRPDLWKSPEHVPLD